MPVSLYSLPSQDDMNVLSKQIISNFRGEEEMNDRLGVLRLALSAIFALGILSQIAAADTVRWVGAPGAGGQDWDVATNWNPNGVPTSTDDVVFDNTATQDCLVNFAATSVSVQSLTTLASFGNKLIFSVAGKTLLVTGAFTLGGGTVEWTAAATLEVQGNFFLNSGTFTPGTGTVKFSGGDAIFYRDINIFPMSSFNLNNVELDKDSAKTLTFGSGISMPLSGTLTLTQGYMSTGSARIVVNNSNVGAVVATEGIINGSILRGVKTDDVGGIWILNDASTYIVGNGANGASVECRSWPNRSPSYGNNPATAAAKRYYQFGINGTASGPRTLSLSYRRAAGGTDVDERNGLDESTWSAWKGNGHYWTVRSATTTYPVSHPANSGAVAVTDSTFSDWTFGGFVDVNTKVFLQGPYSGGSMSTALNTAGFIPLIEPYTAAPWNYSGYESVSSIPAGVVDWVLVKLRINTITTVATRAAFVKSDGSVVDLDGTSPVAFAGVPPGNYYIVVRHRNHLAIMSATTWALSGSSSLYDFTTAQSQAYGFNPMKPVGSSFAMVVGDVDANSGVGASDLVLARSAVGSTTYNASDVDMNGGVGASDLVDIRSSVGQSSQVP
jgi:hypothetical protein